MGELLIVLALVALAAVWLTRRYWRATRQEGPSCGCGGSCGDQPGGCCGGQECQTSIHTLQKEK